MNAVLPVPLGPKGWGKTFKINAMLKHHFLFLTSRRDFVCIIILINKPRSTKIVKFMTRESRNQDHGRVVS